MNGRRSGGVPRLESRHHTAGHPQFPTAHEYAISIDVGGTFTDFVLFDITSGDIVGFHKLLTDDAEPARSLTQGWRELAGMAGTELLNVGHAVHSTTLITNSIVERRGAKTALITTRGFRDVLEIGTEQMYDINDLFSPSPTPLIPRHLRREVSERVTSDGVVLEPLSEDELRAVLDELDADDVRSLAVTFLHSYRNPAHEMRVAEVLQQNYPQISVSLSTHVAPLIGEYERTSTVAADAYVKPLLLSYLSDLVPELRQLGFDQQLFMVLSSGGMTTADAALGFPIRLLESGPAAGAFAASFYGRLSGFHNVLSLDMGGTTAKACLVESGSPHIVHMFEADRVHRFQPGSGLPIMAPTVDLIEIGAGGGSIASVNVLGLLNVGPESAHADPGPASYGLGGTEPTVTDADVVLGYLDPEAFLGGRMRLDIERARHAIQQHVAGPLNLSPMEAAWGIYTIVNENMARAARAHIIERNRDPRKLAVVVLGGAGPAHAIPVARILGISSVVIPLGAGVASAIGALTAPIALPFARSYMTTLADCDWEWVERLFQEMEAEARSSLPAREDSDVDVLFKRAVDLRFAGQYHELRLDLPTRDDMDRSENLIEVDFLRHYRATYGRVPPDMKVEALNWHLVAETPRRQFTLAPHPTEQQSSSTALKGERLAYFGPPASHPQICPVYDRRRLVSGMDFSGPCIIEEPEATAVIPHDARVRIDAYQNIIVQLD